MDQDSHDPALSILLSLTPIGHPNQYLGGRVLSQAGAESMVAAFARGVTCLFHTPDGDAVFSVEMLRIEEGEFQAGVVAASAEDMQRVKDGVAGEDVEPAVRMDLGLVPDPVTGGVPDRIDKAVLVRVHVDLMPRH
jgi:hypothetical protein